MDISNSSQLKSIINQITKIVIDEVSKKLFDFLMKKIGQYVYSGDNAQYAYGSGYPTGEFAESWKIDKHKTSDETIAVIYQDYSVMKSDPDNFVHGSNYYGSKDAREWISVYINEGRSGGIFGDGWWREARPFYDETIKLLEDGTIDKWIKQSYKKLGVTIK